MYRYMCACVFVCIYGLLQQMLYKIYKCLDNNAVVLTVINDELE